jgi:quercetin dioxygenase-like cupin family protein
MSLQPNVVVTGNVAGKAVIVEDHHIRAVTTPALAGLDVYLAWGTPDGTISNDEDVPSAALAPYWPGPGGTRLLLVTWLPTGDTGSGDTPGARSETDRILQGLIASAEVDDPGMHISATLDYGIVVAGEMWLELDDGVERRLAQGTCVVQRGTRHRWVNRTDQPATMAFVLIGTDDAEPTS